MTNEDIAGAIEAFQKWGNDDKIKIVSSLSDMAVQNMMWWLSQSRSGKRFVNDRLKNAEPYFSQYEYDMTKPTHGRSVHDYTR